MPSLCASKVREQKVSQRIYHKKSMEEILRVIVEINIKQKSQHQTFCVPIQSTIINGPGRHLSKGRKGE